MNSSDIDRIIRVLLSDGLWKPDFGEVPRMPTFQPIGTKVFPVSHIADQTLMEILTTPKHLNPDLTTVYFETSIIHKIGSGLYDGNTDVIRNIDIVLNHSIPIVSTLAFTQKMAAREQLELISQDLSFLSVLIRNKNTIVMPSATFLAYEVKPQQIIEYCRHAKLRANRIIEDMNTHYIKSKLIFNAKKEKAIWTNTLLKLKHDDSARADWIKRLRDPSIAGEVLWDLSDTDYFLRREVLRSTPLQQERAYWITETLATILESLPQLSSKKIKKVPDRIDLAQLAVAPICDIFLSGDDSLNQEALITQMKRGINAPSFQRFQRMLASILDSGMQRNMRASGRLKDEYQPPQIWKHLGM